MSVKIFSLVFFFILLSNYCVICKMSFVFCCLMWICNLAIDLQTMKSEHDYKINNFGVAILGWFTFQGLLLRYYYWHLLLKTLSKIVVDSIPFFFFFLFFYQKRYKLTFHEMKYQALISMKNNSKINFKCCLLQL